MGNSLSSLTSALSLLGLFDLGLTSATPANQPFEWLQIYFQSDGSLHLLPIVATVVAGLIVVYLVHWGFIRRVACEFAEIDSLAHVARFMFHNGCRSNLCVPQRTWLL
jgi:hypothetical protein